MIKVIINKYGQENYQVSCWEEASDNFLWWSLKNSLLKEKENSKTTTFQTLQKWLNIESILEYWNFSYLTVTNHPNKNQYIINRWTIFDMIFYYICFSYCTFLKTTSNFLWIFPSRCYIMFKSIICGEDDSVKFIVELLLLKEQI